MNKDTLLNAINNYLLQIQIDSLGDITSKVNAVVTCRDYVANNDINDITADWIKSNLTVILPAITCYRKTLKNNIDEAKIRNDKETLLELRTNYNDLQPYLALLKPFEKLFT